MQEKEVLHKVRSKPLHLTQIEEQAIEELKRLFFYSHQFRFKLHESFSYLYLKLFTYITAVDACLDHL